MDMDSADRRAKAALWRSVNGLGGFLSENIGVLANRVLAPPLVYADDLRRLKTTTICPSLTRGSPGACRFRARAG
jgi:hypothetical protein